MKSIFLSRIAYGTAIDQELLSRIAAAERLLHAAGFRQARLRHHGAIARIELLPEDFSKAVETALLKKITAGLKKLGWHFTTLDLEGYRTGSLNMPALF